MISLQDSQKALEAAPRVMLTLSTKQYRVAQQFAQLLLSDSILLDTIIQAKSIHGDAHLGESLLRVFRAYCRDYELVKVALPKAIESTRAAELLFREDTIYTEMANEFVREHGMEYLRKALKGPLQKVTELASSEDFDIDPTRVPRIEDQKANTSRLLEAADLILDSLHQRMEKYLPPVINDAIGILVDKAVAKFGGNARGIACAVFIFMRFICPAIVNPTKLGLTGKILKPTVTRALLTLSKLIKACVEGSTELAGGNARIVEYLQQVKPRIDAYYTALCRPREHHDQHVKHEQNATIPALAILRHIQSKMNTLSVELKHRGATSTLTALEDLSLALGVERPPRRSMSGSVNSTIESWSTERVLMWLECLGLEEHKLAFSRALITGRMLVNMDPQGLAQIGVTREIEQWRLLQSIQDFTTLDSRYANAERIAGTYEPRPFPPLQRMMHREVARDTGVDLHAVFVLDNDDDDSSISSSSSSSPMKKASPLYDSMNRKFTQQLGRAPSPGLIVDDLPSSANLTTTPAFECVFRCMLPNGVTRMVRGNSAEGWAGFQHRVREELKVPKAAFTYVDPAQAVLSVDNEPAFRAFLATNGTRVPGEPATYRLVLGI